MEAGAKLIVGCGYLGSRIADAWKTQGCEVFALTRSTARAEQWEARGIRPLVGDICETLPQFPAVDTIVHAVGFDRSSGRSMQSVYVEGLNNVVQSAPAELRRFLYISSTGVYGQSNGEWVDEASVCEPEREGGRVCRAAEQLLQTSRLADRVIVLRLAGLYGPGRIPRQADVRAGQPLATDPAGFLNLIHVEDAARIVVEADQRLEAPSLYCVSDGHPCPRSEYFAELARQLDAPPPQFSPLQETAQTETHRAQRALSSKRVSNQRLMRDLAPTLSHPSFREGLRAILAESS